ncbi:MAG TPA: helix-turn-helix transcriptional regulator [Streptosporangiaceae bacterium]|nr:helix-turn-helix transcriptional regulator [Streptosporangiaceae bacterium]
MSRPPRRINSYESPRTFFAAEMRRKREKAGLSMDQVGDQLGYSRQQIGNYEAGQVSPGPKLAKALDRLYETDGIFYEIWLLIEGDVVPFWFRDFPGLERQSADMRIFESQVITGLLQTEDYARELLRATQPSGPVDERVAARMARQEVLTGDDHPWLWVVLDEPVIHRVVGNRSIMKAQFERLLEATDHPKVSIRVLPIACGAHAGLDGSFILLKMDDGKEVLWVEGTTGGQPIEARDRVSEAAVRYDLIRDNALPVEDSLALIAKTMEQL